MKIQNFLAICLFLFLSMTKCENLKVGFITMNLEGHDFSSVQDIKRALGYVANPTSSQRLITSLDQIVNSEAAVENLDVILVAVQEGAFFSDKISTLPEMLSKDWTCSETLTKAGMIKINKIKKIKSKICYKNAKFASNFAVESGIFGKSKGVMGNCLLPVNDEDYYCFMSTHLNVKVDEGVQDLFAAAKEIMKSKNIKRDVFAFIAGDINTRSNLTPDVLEKVLAQPYNVPVETQNKIMGDNSTINKLKDNFNIFGTNLFAMNFLGNDDLRNLPYTYKYKDGIDTTYDTDKIKVMKKLDASDDKVYNLGWLDRLICVYSKTAGKENCNVNNGVKYFEAPVLKKGDHIPVLGYFEIETAKIQQRLNSNAVSQENVIQNPITNDANKPKSQIKDRKKKLLRK